MSPHQDLSQAEILKIPWVYIKKELLRARGLYLTILSIVIEAKFEVVSLLDKHVSKFHQIWNNN